MPRRVWSRTLSSASMIEPRAVDCEAPVIMLRRTRCAGCRSAMTSRERVRKRIWRASMVSALVALGLAASRRNEPFERHAAPRTDGFQHFELAVRAGCVSQQAPDERGLAVIAIWPTMTMESCGRVVPLAPTFWVVTAFTERLGQTNSEIAGDTQPLNASSVS